MANSDGAKRGETREFWEAAIRLWSESGLSVREFCGREGLAEHSFYSWRRELMPKSRVAEVNQESPNGSGRAPAGGRRSRRRKQAAGSAAGENGSAVEFLPVRVVGEQALSANPATVEPATGAAAIEIVGVSPWRVRITASFDPTTLDAVLRALERRPC